PPHPPPPPGHRGAPPPARHARAPGLPKPPRPTLAAGMGVVLAGVVLAFLFWPRASPPPVPAPATARVAAPVVDVVPYLPGDALDQRVRLAGDSPQGAWGQLLGLWTVRANEAALADVANCPPVLAPGLFCLRGRASLDKLAALGRPTLLRLESSEGDAWALLLGADAVRVRLWLGGGRFDTDRLALERAWRGDYAAIWRGPAFLAPPPAAGDSGPAVDWIHDRLRDRAGLDTPDAGPAVLDAASLVAVRRVQTAHGLVADGVIGPETLMALSSGDSDGPRLRRVLD
ncbi:MAG: peptidoglycan-binding protein, partial [Arenimonas sp.]|uniref:peptidoglycan-binding protein n=1 Tax=Arenimonas sp. TaxID=1872635 RepID=UPI0025BEDDB3